jgi:hypothetical protein
MLRSKATSQSSIMLRSRATSQSSIVICNFEFGISRQARLGSGLSGLGAILFVFKNCAKSIFTSYIRLFGKISQKRRNTRGN